jgi:hypothetical protein
MGKGAMKVEEIERIIRDLQQAQQRVSGLGIEGLPQSVLNAIRVLENQLRVEKGQRRDDD